MFSAQNRMNLSDFQLTSVSYTHLDVYKRQPYIYENKDGNGNSLSPEKATLIWQDVQNLVTDVQLSSDKKNLDVYKRQTWR